MTNADPLPAAVLSDGLIWVYGPGDDGVMAFTDFGIETLTGLIEIYKADPDLLKRPPTPSDLAAAYAACLQLSGTPILSNVSTGTSTTISKVALCMAAKPGNQSACHRDMASGVAPLAAPSRSTSSEASP